jgi:hypothetical protein
MATKPEAAAAVAQKAGLAAGDLGAELAGGDVAAADRAGVTATARGQDGRCASKDAPPTG